VGEDTQAKQEPEKGAAEEAHQKKGIPKFEAETPASCRHHLGYLSERGPNQQIPDDCYTCKDSVDCMLKKMRQQ
jgi:hypothetical protein